MRSEYRRDIHHNYLVLEVERQIEEASYQVRMLLANALPMFLQCKIQAMDGRRLLYYEITSKQSMQTIYEEKKFGFEDLRMVFGNFLSLIEKMAEYLLNPDQLVLQPEFIFLDVEKNMYFCYLPGYEKTLREQFRELTEYILPKLDHEDGRAVMLGYGIYRRALEDDFQLEHIKEEIYRSQKESEVHDFEKGGRKEAKVEELFQNGDREQDIAEKDSVQRKPVQRKSVQKGIWKKKGILFYCAATVFLLLLMFAGYYFYPAVWRIEYMIGFGLVFMGVIFGLVFLLQKNDQPEESWERKIREQIEEAEAFEEVLDGRKEKPEVLGKKTGDPERKIEVPERKIEVPERKIEALGKKTESSKKKEEFCGETILLSCEPVKGPATLVSREPGELATIYLQEDLTVVGKMENAADAVIRLPTVSRVHAKIHRKGEDYYLTDLNSKNGTSVNGRMLSADEEYLLQNEDEVDFAQARYIFLK